MPKLSFIFSGALRFPFLGTRREGEPFQYLLMDLSPARGDIAIFKWMVNRTALNLGERVDLHLPWNLVTASEYESKDYSIGTIISIGIEDSYGELHYEVMMQDSPSHMTGENPIQQFIQNETTDQEDIASFLRLIKHSIILKQGLVIYLNHFSPYFSRLVDYPNKDYQELKNVIFKEIIERIQSNIDKLNELFFFFKENVKKFDDVSIYLNLEEFREMMESEIDFDLFLIAFTAKMNKKDFLDLLDTIEERKIDYREEFYVHYLLTLKKLEKRLYVNYNQVVLIYMKSLMFDFVS